MEENELNSIIAELDSQTEADPENVVAPIVFEETEEANENGDC